MPVDEADVVRNIELQSPEKTEQDHVGSSGHSEMIRESQSLPDGRSITFYWFDEFRVNGDRSDRPPYG